MVDPLKDQPHELHQRDQECAEGEAAQVEAHLGTYTVAASSACGCSLGHMGLQPGHVGLQP